MSGNQDFVIKKGVLQKYKGPGGDVTIPAGVTEIGYGAFRGCTSLTSVTIPAGVTEIGAWAFQGCANLTSVTIPAGVTEIGSSAFFGCTGLTSVTIPAGVTEIGRSAFSGCTGLTSVTIPEGVKIIGEYAFFDCKKLEPPRELLRGEKKLPVGLTETIRELWRGELQPKDWAGLYLFQEAKAWTELFQKYMPNSQTEEIAQAMAELLAGSGSIEVILLFRGPP